MRKERKSGNELPDPDTHLRIPDLPGLADGVATPPSGVLLPTPTPLSPEDINDIEAALQHQQQRRAQYKPGLLHIYVDGEPVAEFDVAASRALRLRVPRTASRVGIYGRDAAGPLLLAVFPVAGVVAREVARTVVFLVSAAREEDGTLAEAIVELTYLESPLTAALALWEQGLKQCAAALQAACRSAFGWLLRMAGSPSKAQGPSIGTLGTRRHRGRGPWQRLSRFPMAPGTWAALLCLLLGLGGGKFLWGGRPSVPLVSTTQDIAAAFDRWELALQDIAAVFDRAVFDRWELAATTECSAAQHLQDLTRRLQQILPAAQETRYRVTCRDPSFATVWLETGQAQTKLDFKYEDGQWQLLKSPLEDKKQRWQGIVLVADGQTILDVQFADEKQPPMKVVIRASGSVTVYTRTDNRPAQQEATRPLVWQRTQEATLPSAWQKAAGREMP